MLKQKELIKLTNKIRVRDTLTYEHSFLGAAYAVACARQMGLSNQKLRHLYQGMLLHDIGKMQISTKILYKKKQTIIGRV